MFRRQAALFSAAAACMLLAVVCVAVPPEQAASKVLFDLKPFGGARATVTPAKMRSIQLKIGLEHKTLDELFEQLDADDDLGVDVEEEVLVYRCKPPKQGPPESTAGTASAAAAIPETAEGHPAAATEAPTAEVALEAVPVDVPGHHHHHHHHHRHLLQQADMVPEWDNTWLPSLQDSSMATYDCNVVFKLHSRPAASKKIYLDFNGHVTNNTYWNTNAWPQSGGKAIVSTPYSYDDYPNGFSSTECINIAKIWRQVVEDFAPFDVDVTTEEPSAAVPLKDWVRVVITNDRDWTCSSSCGYGVSIIGGGFDPTKGHYYQPAFVFVGEIGSQSTRRIADVASHEVGHNLKLNHDGTSTASVYQGYNGWSPIMGNSFNNPSGFVQWSMGEYTGANNKEDDCKIISETLNYIPQLHGSSLSGATPLGGVLSADQTTATASVTGVVRMPTDAEFMWFRASRAGTASVSVLVQPPDGSVARSNLNLRFRLFDANGAEITAATRGGIGIPAYDVSLPNPGIYYTSISGVGNPDNYVTSSTGYSSYGSRGVYQINLVYPSDGNMDPPPPFPQMNIAWSGSKQSVSKNQVTCTITATVTSVGAPAQAVSGVSIAGKWTASTSTKGFPYDVTAVSTGSNGVATFISKAFSPTTTTGNVCTFAISTISKAGYELVPGALTSFGLK